MLIAAATRGAKSNAASILDQLDKQVAKSMISNW